MSEKKEEFFSKLIDLRRTTRVTAGGKRFSFRAAVIVGDKKGKVGLGQGKAKDAAEAIEKAIKNAKKNLIELPIIDETIPFEIEKKFSSAKVFLRPQKKGRGIRAGGVIGIICELGGISNINAKLISSTKNKINIAKACLSAFEEIKKILSKKEKNDSTSPN